MIAVQLWSIEFIEDEKKHSVAYVRGGDSVEQWLKDGKHQGIAIGATVRECWEKLKPLIKEEIKKWRQSEQAEGETRPHLKDFHFLLYSTDITNSVLGCFWGTEGMYIFGRKKNGGRLSDDE